MSNPGHFLPVQPRILARTDRSTGCWIWLGAMDKGTGYGRMTALGVSTTTHRAAYQAFVGPVPAGFQIDHLCRVRACCNPGHLEAVKPQENLRRSTTQWAVNARTTSCRYGHAYDATHVIRPDGTRRCTLCALLYTREFRRMSDSDRAARKAAGLPVVDMAQALMHGREAA